MLVAVGATHGEWDKPRTALAGPDNAHTWSRTAPSGPDTWGACFPWVAPTATHGVALSGHLTAHCRCTVTIPYGDFCAGLVQK